MTFPEWCQLAMCKKTSQEKTAVFVHHQVYKVLRLLFIAGWSRHFINKRTLLL